MQPDLVGTTRFGRIAIEIAVTSFCDERKREVISALAMPTIEIDLSRFHGNDFDPSVVREFVLNSHEGKYWIVAANEPQKPSVRSEEQTSELQSLMSISYAVFCLKKKN